MVHAKASPFVLMVTVLSVVAVPALSMAQVADVPGASKTPAVAPGARDETGRNPNPTAERSRQDFEQRLRMFEQRRREMRNRLTQTPQPSNRPTRLSLRNETSSTIWAALYYLPYPGPNAPTEPGASAGNGPWKLEAWITLKPGEMRFIGQTNNITIYTYGTDASGRVWGGDDFHQQLYFSPEVGYRNIGFKKQTLAAHPNDYTFGFARRK